MFTMFQAKQMEVGYSCINEDQGEMVLRAGQDGWMDDRQRGISYCKSSLIENVLFAFNYSPRVLMKHYACVIE